MRVHSKVCGWAARGEAHDLAWRRARDIEPRAGRLVLFQSRRCWHEVMPATGRRRLALTQWINCESHPFDRSYDKR